MSRINPFDLSGISPVNVWARLVAFFQEQNPVPLFFDCQSGVPSAYFLILRVESMLNPIAAVSWCISSLESGGHCLVDRTLGIVNDIRKL